MAKWTPKHEAPEPLEGPVVATITGGTILWFVLFVAQLPFYGWYEDHGRTWWIWTCLAGGGLGLYGIWFVRKRDAAIKRDAAVKQDAATKEDAAAEDAARRTTTGSDAGSDAGSATGSDAGSDTEAADATPAE